jgi:hypothetical protein
MMLMLFQQKNTLQFVYSDWFVFHTDTVIQIAIQFWQGNYYDVLLGNFHSLYINELSYMKHY